MILNFFDNRICLFINETYKPLVLALIAISVQGCSILGGSVPANGKANPTNPYVVKPVLKTTPLKTSKKAPPLQQIKPVRPRNDLHTTSQTIRKPLSPAVLALVSEAEKNSKAGNLESAVVTIERALRIDSRNPTLTYKLAELRLKQSKPRLAEDLAKKAALLSGKDKSLKRKSWLLISEARRQQKNFYGAKEAKLKAGSL